MRPCLIPILAAALAACSQFPELDASVSDQTRRAPYPDLVPLDTLTARIGEYRITSDMSDATLARAANLKSQTGRRGTSSAVADPARVARLRARATELRATSAGN